MPLVTNNLGGRHTHTQTHTEADIYTETILRNRQALAVPWHVPGLKMYCKSKGEVVYPSLITLAALLYRNLNCFKYKDELKAFERPIERAWSY